MIAFIEGKLVKKDPTHVLIDVGGIGYHIHIALNTFSGIGDSEFCHLHTYLHIKEDAHTLYGFLSEEDKQLFLALISISGIGPSTALMMQSSLSSDEIKQAITSEQVHVIQGVKGIGLKTAQRVILELKNKFIKEGISSESGGFSTGMDNKLRDEALSALLTLGIAKNVAQKSIDGVLRNYGNNVTLEELIKLSLQAS